MSNFPLVVALKHRIFPMHSYTSSASFVPLHQHIVTTFIPSCTIFSFCATRQNRSTEPSPRAHFLCGCSQAPHLPYSLLAFLFFRTTQPPKRHYSYSLGHCRPLHINDGINKFHRTRHCLVPCTPSATHASTTELTPHHAKLVCVSIFIKNNPCNYIFTALDTVVVHRTPP